MKFNPAYSEAELVLLIKQNDKAAFSYLYRNYAGVLLFIIQRIISDQHTAEDILSEVFVQIWNKSASMILKNPPYVRG